MKAEFINPFVYAGMRVLSAEAGLHKWVPDKPYLIRADSTRLAVNVVVGVVGTVQGLVVYAMDLSVAKGILKAMAGTPIPMSDPMAKSALGELGNLITGLASRILEENGYPCRISPPAIIRGTAVRMLAKSTPMVLVPITTELGDIKIHLALSEVDQTADPQNTTAGGM